MKKVMLGVAVGALGVVAWNHRRPAEVSPAPAREPVYDTRDPEESTTAPAATHSYSCDGRIYCSQMTSCDEAKYFLANCPGVKMDGEGDGVPCERQWCRNEG